MNQHDHHAIVRLAFSSLRDRADAGLLALQERIAESCMLPDEVAIPLLEGKDGHWRRYFPRVLPKFNFEHDQRDLHALLPVNGFYVREIIRALRRQDYDSAARFLGVYSHYIGDFTQPAHHYELDIGLLLPPPAVMRNCNYHRMLEDVEATVTTLRRRPCLLGSSPHELLFRLPARYAALFERSVAAVIPMTRAIYRGQFETASRVMDRIVLDSAALFADFCCTVWAIAQRRFRASDLRRLQACDLRNIPPSAYDAEFNFSHRPLIDAVSVAEYGPATRFALFYPRPGDQPAAIAVNGVCVIPHALPLPGVPLGAMLEYRLPRDVFSRFEADVGLLAGETRQAACRFEVLADGRSLFSSPSLKPGDCALHVALDIARCRKLRLTVTTDGSTDKLAFPIWAEPRLLK